MMERIGYIVSPLALMSATLVAAAQPAAIEKVDLSGGWIFVVELVGNTGAPVFVLKQDGEQLKGTYRGRFGEADLKGSVKGDKIEFSFEIQGNTITYTGTIKKDCIEGEADYAGQATATWKGKRIDLSGTWDLETEVAGKSETMELKLTQDDAKLSGTCKSTAGEMPVKGAVTGDKVELTCSADGRDIVYKGTIDRDAFKGEFTSPGQSAGSFGATRQAKK